MTHSIKTLCPYCGVVCGLDVSPPAVPNKLTHRDGSVYGQTHHSNRTRYGICANLLGRTLGSSGRRKYPDACNILS